jgi:hypothetical protein
MLVVGAAHKSDLGRYQKENVCLSNDKAHISMLWLDEYARQQAHHGLPLTAYYPCVKY